MKTLAALTLIATIGWECLRPSFAPPNSNLRSAPVLSPDPPAIRFLVGSLSEPLSAVVGSAIGADSQGILVVLATEDCFTCEDLGRQLREVLHSPGSAGSRLVVILQGNDSTRVAGWLRRERVNRGELIRPVSALSLSDSTPIPTPAVLLVRRSGRIVRGVAHLTRVPNSRARSFTQELSLSTSTLMRP